MGKMLPQYGINLLTLSAMSLELLAISWDFAFCPMLHVYPVKFAGGDYFTGALCPRPSDKNCSPRKIAVARQRQPPVSFVYPFPTRASDAWPPGFFPDPR